MTDWNLICEQIDKIRFKKKTNSLVFPQREEFDDGIVTAPSDLSDTDAQTYSSTDMFNRQDYPKKKVRKIKNQLRKKTPKKKKEDRIVDKSLLLSARLRKKSV